jgi:hypothetical protein
VVRLLVWQQVWSLSVQGRQPSVLGAACLWQARAVHPWSAPLSSASADPGGDQGGCGLPRHCIVLVHCAMPPTSCPSRSRRSRRLWSRLGTPLAGCSEVASFLPLAVYRRSRRSRRRWSYRGIAVSSSTCFADIFCPCRSKRSRRRWSCR